MTRYRFSYVDLPDTFDPDLLKLNGGFELADKERAKLELKQTQMKLAGRHARPEDNPAFTTKEDALDELHRMLSGKTQEDTMKQNSKPSLAEARRNLRRTQASFSKVNTA